MQHCEISRKPTLWNIKETNVFNCFCLCLRTLEELLNRIFYLSTYASCIFQIKNTTQHLLPLLGLGCYCIVQRSLVFAASRFFLPCSRRFFAFCIFLHLIFCLVHGFGIHRQISVMMRPFPLRIFSSWVLAPAQWHFPSHVSPHRSF